MAYSPDMLKLLAAIVRDMRQICGGVTFDHDKILYRSADGSAAVEYVADQRVHHVRVSLYGNPIDFQGLPGAGVLQTSRGGLCRRCVEKQPRTPALQGFDSSGPPASQTAGAGMICPPLLTRDFELPIVVWQHSIRPLIWPLITRRAVLLQINGRSRPLLISGIAVRALPESTWCQITLDRLPANRKFRLSILCLEELMELLLQPALVEHFREDDIPF